MDQITEEDFGMPKNVFNDVFILSEKQEQLMEILWKSDKSLTSMDIMQILNDPHADYTYVVRMLSLLEKTHMISEVGTVPSGKKRARLFVPALTRQQYAVRLALATGITREDVPEVASALIQEVYGFGPEFGEKLNALIASSTQ